MTGSFLRRMALEARGTVSKGYYDVEGTTEPRPSLAEALQREGPGIVAEVKPASPTAGPLRDDVDAADLARGFLDAGARGVSVLTEPTRFGGSLANLRAAATAGGPVLFKDFVVDGKQLDAATVAGASAVLLIPALLDHASVSLDVDSAIEEAHTRGLEVLLEVYDAEGYEEALATDAAIIGVNNRDLRDPSLPIDLDRTARVLAEHPVDRPVMALSGVKDRADVHRQLDAGADAVLVGTTLMQAADPVARLRELMA